MRRLLILRRARRACQRALTIYEIARWRAAQGDLCQAGKCRALADKLASYALDDLAAAEPYLLREVPASRQPPKRQRESERTWTIADDLPRPIPVGRAALEVLETFLGADLDDLIDRMGRRCGSVDRNTRNCMQHLLDRPFILSVDRRSGSFSERTCPNIIADSMF